MRFEMSRRKRGAVVAALLAAVACLLLVRGRCGSGAGDGALRAPGGVQRPAERRRPAAVDPGTRWSLYGQRNVARRRAHARA